MGMNTTEIYDLIATYIASLTAVIAIVLMIKQTRQLDNTLRSQVYQGLIETSFKIDELLIESPEYRKYIYGNEIINDNTPDIEKITGVIEYVVDIADNIMTQEEFIPKSERLGWMTFAKEILSSPAAKFFLKTNRKWYSGKISEIT
jgi:hypothetical protein